MSDHAHDWLAQRFETSRPHLRAVAYRMLGSAIEADDAVQEAWLRVNRAGASGVENLSGWLTTIVSRVCLDMLRSRQARHEEPLDEIALEPLENQDSALDPEHEALLTDSVGIAMQVVLDTLAPAERVAFVLHDVFGLAFEEIAPIVGRSPVATRQLASRARRRVQGTSPSEDPAADTAQHKALVDAFLAASRGGNLGALLTMLDPDVVLHSDAEGERIGTPAPMYGAAAVAGFFSGRAHSARPVLIDGVPGLMWAPGGKPRVIFSFTFSGGAISDIELIADRERIEHMELEVMARQRQRHDLP
jgi:RNA polymerase sigma-70 factor (ECF subfamily)